MGHIVSVESTFHRPTPKVLVPQKHSSQWEGQRHLYPVSLSFFKYAHFIRSSSFGMLRNGHILVCEHVRQLKEVTVVQTTNFQILDMITSVCLKLIHGTQKNIGPLSCPLHSAFSTSSACMQWRSCVCFRNHPSTDLLAFCNSGLEEDDDSSGLDL